MACIPVVRVVLVHQQERQAETEVLRHCAEQVGDLGEAVLLPLRLWLLAERPVHMLKT